ncbi:MAG: hypothetical protein Q8T04_12685 [Bacteroidota bacterium]|nr:hypothetical protein [Bacteroidota bacterium]
MEYYFSATLHTDFDDAVAKITEALKTEGFGVLTEIEQLKILHWSRSRKKLQRS